MIAAALLLTACQSMTPEERRAADENTCASYGFRRGTENFATCLMNIDLDHRAERRSIMERQQPVYFPPVIVERRIIVRN